MSSDPIETADEFLRRLKTADSLAADDCERIIKLSYPDWSDPTDGEILHVEINGGHIPPKTFADFVKEWASANGVTGDHGIEALARSIARRALDNFEAVDNHKDNKKPSPYDDDPKRLERDEWLFHQRLNGDPDTQMPWETLLGKLNDVVDANGWEPIANRKTLTRTVKQYANHIGKALPEGKPGRPKRS
jgi:hypothetical protein